MLTQHTLMRVDLPAPLGPNTAIRAAMLAFMLTSFSCGFGAPSYWNVTFLHFRTGFSLDLQQAARHHFLFRLVEARRS